MKPEVFLKECPARIWEKGREQRFINLVEHKYARRVYLICQEMEKGLLYTWIYQYEDAGRPGARMPEKMIAADMERRTWDTYDVVGGKWGKATLEYLYPHTEYAGSRIDMEKYGISLEQMQQEVLYRRTVQRYKDRRQKVEREMGRARDLPDAFLRWAKRHMDPFMVYQPGEGKEGYCTCCGKKSVFRRRMRIRQERRCRHCGTVCRCATPKTMPERTWDTFSYLHKAGNGVMFRFVSIERENREYPDFQYRIEEKIRVVVYPGKRQWWYERVPFYGAGGLQYRWERNRVKKWRYWKNAPGYGYRKRERTLGRGGRVQLYRNGLPGIFRGHPLGYIPDRDRMVQHLMARKGYAEEAYALIDLYEALARYPVIETLWKLGFHEMAVELCGNMEYAGIKRDRRAHKALVISKEMWRQLCREPERESMVFGVVKKLRRFEEKYPDKHQAYQIAQYFREHQLALLARAGIDAGRVMEYCRGKDWLPMYMDYVQMAERLGYDMRDRFTVFPRDVKTAHDQALDILHEESNRAALEEAEKEDGDIREVYEKVKRRLAWQDGGLVIRPVMSNREIVREGQVLHHCVGCGIYKDKMKANASYILLLRRTEAEDMPYYTVEVSPAGEVVQAYGKYNTKPDWETVGMFLEKFTEKVRERDGKVNCPA